MKKLLIAMTAVAVGTCAWAEGEQTLLNETFESTWTLTDNTWWTYSAGEAADGELTLLDTGKLSLNTGSKVLTGSFTSDDQPRDIGDGLYFNASVKFKDPSDTLPELGEGDKFALVVLDNVESVDAKYTSDAATNLWVIAKYGENSQRAYRLNVEVTESWLAAEHSIVVKGYENVMASGNTACAGFLVMVDKVVCTVVESCAIVNNVIDYGTACAFDFWLDGDNNDLGYLGYAKSAIAGSIQKRYEDAQLILSNVPNSDTLASVDFQGQGEIDNVSLATTTVEEFGSDSLVFTVEGTANGVTITSDTTVYYSAAGEKKNITFTLATGWVLKGVAAGLTPDDNGVYTYQYTTVAENDQVVKIEAYLPAAYVGGTAYESFDDALAAVNSNGGTLKLTKPVEVAYMEFVAASEVVLDLNGQTITGTSADYATIVNTGILKIVDYSEEKDGTVAATVVGSVENNATLTIEGGIFAGEVKTLVLEWEEEGENISFGAANTAVSGGTFNGAFIVTPYEGETEGLAASVSVTGGKFIRTANTTVAGVAEGYEATDDNAGYWVVAEKPAAPAEPLPDLEIDENATAEDEKAAVTEALGTQADAAVVANITNAAEYAEFKTWAGTVTGGAAAVVASENAWVAFALDNASLLAGDKVTLADSDITVESFGQAENAAAGQFTLEISLKDVTIGNATKANLLKIFEAVGTTDLKADFTAGAVTTDVVAAGGKAKFTVAPSAATKPNAFFFKAQIKK